MYLILFPQNFFHPRQMEVTLAQGRVRHSGVGDDLPPDMLHHNLTGNIFAPSSRSVATYDGSLSDDEPDSEASALNPMAFVGFGGKHAVRDALRKERKDLKAERRMMKRDARGSEGEQWRLIVSFRQPVL